jgi:hypothetical protein
LPIPISEQRWGEIQAHLVNRKLSQSYLKQVLDRTPIGSQRLASMMLHFLVGGLRPLTLEEMRIAITIQSHHYTIADTAQPDIYTTIVKVLGPLVRINDSRIFPVPQLKEFLTSLAVPKETPLSATYGVDPRKANLLLADIFISYLLRDDFKQVFSVDHLSDLDSPLSPDLGFLATSSPQSAEDGGSIEQLYNLSEDTMSKDPLVLEAEAYEFIRRQYPFFGYSATRWPAHFSSACSISPPELQNSVLVLSDATSIQGSNWFRFYWLHIEKDLPPHHDFVPIVTASYFGHLTSLKPLVPIKPDSGESGIYWAARRGYVDVVDLLLHERVNPDVKVINGQNALTAAIQFNHLEVVKCLLEDEGFISEQDGYRVNYAPTRGHTPLSIAVKNGHFEVARQLLQHNQIQPNLVDLDQWTPLFWSIGKYHLDVLQLLLIDGRISVNHLDRSG